MKPKVERSRTRRYRSSDLLKVTSSLVFAGNDLHYSLRSNSHGRYHNVRRAASPDDGPIRRDQRVP